MQVRRAATTDVEAMVDVAAVVAEEGSIGTEPPVDRTQLADRLQVVIDTGDPSAAWVLIDEDEVVGSTTLREQVPGVLGLGMMILPAGRGRGGGRLLLDTVLEHAVSCGIHKVTLEVWPDNGRAIALYVAAGFVVEGLKHRHYRRRDGTLRSALLMARHTGE